MYSKRLCFLCCVLFCIAAQSQNIQQNRLDSFTGKLITSIRSQSSPRAFLSIDKSIFKAGETVWFNASILNSVSQKITTKTKYLFVDLVNEKDNVLTSVILNASGQQLNGRIVLPQGMPEGYYWMRAYTRQMAKGDTANCAVQPIYVFSPGFETEGGKHTGKAAVIGENAPVMDFYPEGGSLITGAVSTVAFHIYDKGEMPVTVEGVVKDNLDSTTTHFSSSDNGLGKFSFSPSRHRKYRADITWKGQEYSYPLPAFNFYAAQLSVTIPEEGKKKVRVLLEDSVYSNNFITYIIGVSKDSLCFAGVGRGQYELSLPDQKFPEGIATFYLFDDNFKLLSERSIYERDNNVIVKASLDKNVYPVKSKVALKIAVTDKNLHPVSSLLSVSVSDSLFANPLEVCTLPWFDETNKRKIINNPSLARLQCLTSEEMDLVMLLRNNTYPSTTETTMKFRQGEDKDSLLHIRGTVVSDKDEPLPGKIVNLFSKAGNGAFSADTTDDNGRFYFPIEGYSDSTEFTINVKSLSGKNQATKVLVDSVNLPVFKTPVSLKQKFLAEPVIAKYRAAYTNDVFSAPDKNSLPAVKLVSEKAVNYDATRRVSRNSSILTPEDIAEGASLGNAILNVPGMHILNGFLVINGLTSFNSPNALSEPLILVDGAQVALSQDVGNSSPDLSYLNSLNVKDVDFVEVLKGPDGANYGIRGGNGVILINMAHDRRDQPGAANKFNNFYLKGIFKPVNFPAVLTADKQTNAAPATKFDEHSTILWDANILSDASNKPEFSFLTGDVPATYKITITGITVHGDIIYKTLTFQSK